MKSPRIGALSTKRLGRRLGFEGRTIRKRQQPVTARARSAEDEDTTVWVPEGSRGFLTGTIGDTYDAYVVILE